MTLKREVIDYALPRGLIEPVRSVRPTPPPEREVRDGSTRTLRRVTDGK